MTAISWTNETWNPIVGCSIVSKGCTNCYAMKMAGRLEAMAVAQMSKTGAPGALAHYMGTTSTTVKGKTVWTGKMAMAPDSVLTKPLSWKKPRMIFVNSMSDLFHPDVPFAWIDRVFAIIALTPQHTHQILTKRPDRMFEYFSGDWAHRVYQAAMEMPGYALGVINIERGYLHNVWLGVSIEDQATADERIPILLNTPAAIRWISAEPLLGPVDLTAIKRQVSPGFFGDVLQWYHRGLCHEQEGIIYPTINWVVVGGESGPGARPMHPDWARQIRDLCAEAGVPFFFKQWGTWLGGEMQDFGDFQRFDAASTPDFILKNYDPECVHFFDEEAFPSGPIAVRVGKKAAGDLLDGVRHHNWPKTVEVSA